MTQPIALIGAGMIGQSWAISFARAGHEVRLFDSMEAAAVEAHGRLREGLRHLEEGDLLIGQGAGEVFDRIRPVNCLTDALRDVRHVQESAPEDVEVKRALFVEMDALAPPEAVLASSTSALLPSRFMADLPGSGRCLVAHPLNPPHLIPAVEIIPSPATSRESLDATLTLMEGAGQRPFAVAREIEGFVMNRLQGALLDEAMTLVAQGYVSVVDIDIAMRDGLARRWAFMGPFETIDLNAPNGIADFICRYGSAYAEIGRHRPNRPSWTGALAEHVVAARRTVLPAERLPERQSWRDHCLAQLSHLLRKLEP